MLLIDPLIHFDCFVWQIDVFDIDGFLSCGLSDHKSVELDASLAHYVYFIDNKNFVV